MWYGIFQSDASAGRSHPSYSCVCVVDHTAIVEDTGWGEMESGKTQGNFYMVHNRKLRRYLNATFYTQLFSTT